MDGQRSLEEADVAVERRHGRAGEGVGVRLGVWVARGEHSPACLAQRLEAGDNIRPPLLGELPAHFARRRLAA
eukprot:5435774-Pleurochrysis_carterae.AAC.1